MMEKHQMWARNTETTKLYPQKSNKLDNYEGPKRLRCVFFLHCLKLGHTVNGTLSLMGWVYCWIYYSIIDLFIIIIPVNSQFSAKFEIQMCFRVEWIGNSEKSKENNKLWNTSLFSSRIANASTHFDKLPPSLR